MFVGAINSGVRAFLAAMSPQLDGKVCVVGCSGNFTSEAVLTFAASPKAVHSNDVSLYSSLAGAHLIGEDFLLWIKDERFNWLNPYLADSTTKLAAVMILLDMLQWEKQANTHQKRMWSLYRSTFDVLMDKTLQRIANTKIRVDSYFAGDVSDHFKAHDTPDAVFMCYAPTYAGGYERMYKKLDAILGWNEPTYSLLDEPARDNLLAWMRERKYVWYDDRDLPGMKPVMIQKAGRARTVYIYSNLTLKPSYLIDQIPPGLPKYPLLTEKHAITPASTIQLAQIKTSDLARYKNAYLGKNIVFSQGSWAFMVVIDGLIAGFIEFSRGKFSTNEMYLNSDFAVTNMRYKRLSKLMPMLAISGETRSRLERLNQLKIKEVTTTAFTDKPVSMKYRGIMELVKRGKDKDGKQFLNYSAIFNQRTWKETLEEWLTKHGSQRS